MAFIHLSNRLAMNEIKAKNWYRDVHQWCRTLSVETGYTLEQVVGVLVSLSAQKRWALNREQCLEVLDGRKVTGLCSRAQLDACDRILNGEHPLDVWSSRSLKYRSFYACIINPDCKQSVCIDSIMIRWYKSRYPECWTACFTAKQIFESRKRYETVQNYVRDLANAVELVPMELQAWIWCRQRGAIN